MQHQCCWRAGFPTRKAIRPFAQRYKLLLRGAFVGLVISDLEDEVRPAAFCRFIRADTCDPPKTQSTQSRLVIIRILL